MRRSGCNRACWAQAFSCFPVCYCYWKPPAKATGFFLGFLAWLLPAYNSMICREDLLTLLGPSTSTIMGGACSWSPPELTLICSSPWMGAIW